MAFPQNPVSGQTFVTPLNTSYIYDSTRTAWLLNSSTNTGVQVVTATDNTTTLTSSSPAYTVIQGAGLYQNVQFPDARTLTNGQQYEIDYNATGMASNLYDGDSINLEKDKILKCQRNHLTYQQRSQQRSQP